MKGVEAYPGTIGNPGYEGEALKKKEFRIG
jgi:hypothetical protein